MPAGALVTVPLPVPPLLTVRVRGCRSKVAVTVVAALRVTVQAPVPAQPPPLQPAKVEPAAGVAVRVTTVPLAKLLGATRAAIDARRRAGDGAAAGPDLHHREAKRLRGGRRRPRWCNRSSRPH